MVVLLTGAIMPAFLIMTGLSVVFYLALLVFLYRGGRKTAPQRRRVSLQGAGRIRGGNRSAAGNRLCGPLPPSAKCCYGPGSVRREHRSRQGKVASHPESKPAKVITLPTFARDNDDVQCR